MGLVDGDAVQRIGGHAEYTAWKAGVTRADADEFSWRSHQKAIAAIDNGAFLQEIVPVEIKGRKGATVISVDEPPRRDTTLESLASLKPAFVKDMPKEVTEPVVTAGNAPGLNDGAAAVVVTSEEYAHAHGLKILARVAHTPTARRRASCPSRRCGAVRRMMEKEGKQIAITM
jgi:acetyl-CoA C-acetyltransferase